MMTGTVIASREAALRLVVQSSSGQEREIEAILDTGFNGSLTLPPDVVADLSLPFRMRGRALLADGSEIQYDVHTARIIWDGIPRMVPVAVADADPLLGMELLYGYNVNIDVVDGGLVEIRLLTP